MTIEEINKHKLPIIRIDPKLDKLAKMNLFPEKLDEANRILARVGLPENKPKKRALKRAGKKKYSTNAEKKLSLVNEPLPKYARKKKPIASKHK